MSKPDFDTSPDVDPALETPATVDQAHLDRERLARPRIKPGGKIGRYLIVDLLGEGGMGVVYRSYDPELDRRIALKLVRVARRDEQQAARARARLLREAQALAKLSHPNVIAVHDAGTLGDDVFVAMELVEGPPLRIWLREPRPERQILAVFVGAGRGLAAAHDAGLVHRDFKPENVIVGPDGRPRVLDFGLARAAASHESLDDTGGDPPAAPELETGPKRLATPVTIEGAVMGTPAYMAPEQQRDGTADARSDQFSFCVALYEALCGRRPSISETPDRTEPGPGRSGEPARAPRRLKPWLQRIVNRGLALDPRARYPSMHALLADLGRDPAARSRRIAMAALVVGLGGVAAAALVLASPDDDRCGGARARLAGVWDGATRAKLDAAFSRTGRGHARDTADRVARQLDRHASAWVTFHTESCRATARGEQSARLLDLRNACLERRRDELAALTAVLTVDPSPEVVDRSLLAVLALPAIDRCRDDDALAAAVPPPDDPAVRERIADLTKRLDEVQAMQNAGEFATSTERAEAIAKEARAVAFAPIRATALYVLGGLYQKGGRHDEAEALYREVVQLAGEARDDYLVANALVRQVEATGRQPARLSEAEALAPVALGIIARLKDSTPVKASLEMALGTANHRAGKYEQSKRHYEQALALCEAQGVDQAQIASIVTNLGVLYETGGQYAEARKRHQRALELSEGLLGREHPDLVAPLNNLANVSLREGKYDEAEGYHRRALAIMQKTLAPDHPEIATSLNNLAIVFQERGDYAKARELYEQGVAMHIRVLGPDDPSVGAGLSNLGEVMLLGGKPADALASYERALANWAKSLPKDHPMTAYALTGVGKCQNALGKPALALAPLERALAIRSASGEDPVLAAETRFALARALWATKRTRPRALTLATAARDAYRTAGDHHAKAYAEVEGWLADRPR